jgi:hypothetical protein
MSGRKFDKCGSKIPLQEKGLSAALCLVAVVPSDFEKSPMIRALVSGQVKLQIPPLRFASVGMTKGRVSFSV